MRALVSSLIALVFALSGCQLTKPSAPAVPDDATTISSEKEIEQLRRIASEDEEDSDDDGDDEKIRPIADNGAANIEVFRAKRGELWEHDPGPDVNTPAGRGYAELFANTPNYRAIGQFMLANGANDRSDKFRWQFGPMFYRGRLGQNQVKVLIIGQEGAQDENVSDRSFTGGTGGRMQNMLGYMGLDRSYLFINTFVYTITGQYADYAPVLENGRLTWRNLLQPNMLLLAQDPRSPIVQHRNALIDHVIEANRDSLKLIIAVGGAAQDSLSTYIQSRGGECLPEVTDPSKIQAVAYRSESAGGNKRFYFPVDSRGNNLLVNPGERVAFDDPKVQNQLKARAREPGFMNRIVPLTNGPMRNGLVDLRQTTMRLETCKVAGRNNTLFGLPNVRSDIRYIGVQHPGSNSPTLQAKFSQALGKIQSWQAQGWRIEPDRDNNGRVMNQPFGNGFRYSHLPVPRRDFRFGLPDVIGLGTTNTTRRAKGTALEIGSRDAGRYAQNRDAYQPDQNYQNTDVPNEPPKSNPGAFDYGPGEKWGRIFTQNLPVEALAKANRTAAPKFGAWAIYRGRPASTEVLVIADQTSHDDMWVGRAQMGLEGQRLQGFLTGIGAGLNYTILRTLPVDTLGADARTVQQLLEISRNWRNEVVGKILQENRGQVKMILTLGPQAENEIRTMNVGGVPVISLTGPNGYQQGFQQIQRVPAWAGSHRMNFNANPMPIAREDIPYGMRRWTGTAGDRVIRAGGNQSGQLYLITAPEWAVRGPAARARPMSQMESSQLQKMRLPTM